MSHSSNMFTSVVREEQLSKFFTAVQTAKGYAPARMIMREVWADFVDKDHNFLEQWQTTGFNSRTWEFYLFAYFMNSGYRILNDFAVPDFIVEKDGERVAIEAVTTNPRPNLDRAYNDPYIYPFDNLPSAEQIAEAQENELPIRFGSPLFSKLNKKYWELPQCSNIPIVIAIEAFHDPTALFFSSSSLSSYLFGLRVFPTWTEAGEMLPASKAVERHSSGSKVIPSNFFKQPTAEHISAVLFSNAGTLTKFNRIGYQMGYGTDEVLGMIREGFCYDPDVNAHLPRKFVYDVLEREDLESWGEGLDIILNPNAINPLPKDFFVDSATSYIVDSQIVTDVPMPFHPYGSQTLTFTAPDE